MRRLVRWGGRGRNVQAALANANASHIRPVRRFITNPRFSFISSQILAKSRVFTIYTMGLFFPVLRVEQAHFSHLTTCLTTCGDFCTFLGCKKCKICTFVLMQRCKFQSRLLRNNLWFHIAILSILWYNIIVNASGQIRLLVWLVKTSGHHAQSMMYITRHTLYLYVSLVLNDSRSDGLKESRLHGVTDRQPVWVGVILFVPV